MSGDFHPPSYWEARLRKSYTLEGVGHQRLGKHFNGWAYRARAHAFERALQLANIGRGINALDVGSGTGFYIKGWHRHGAASVAGADITSVAVEQLSLRWPSDTFARFDIGDELPDDHPVLRRGAFDAITIMEVLFHVVDEERFARALRNLASLLRPGGYLLWSDVFPHMANVRQTQGHFVSRPLEVSERVVRDAGLEIVRRLPMFTLLGYPEDTRGRLPRLAWSAMVAPAALFSPLGWPIGAALYPLDRWLTARRDEGPSTEIMICRKPTSGGDA